MTRGGADVIVAGHICLDLIPAMRDSPAGLDGLLVPGKLIDVGAAAVATGGAVSNTGIALHRLGVRVKLMGKIGDDRFGGAIVDMLRESGAELADGMIVAAGETTSYTVVINPPQVDRIFLHCTGANDTFAAADVRDEELCGARLFHFGYPPLMRRMYEDGGIELERLLSRVRTRGLAVSLDLARPDPHSPAGRADWNAILARALPQVDLFLPSLDETMAMLMPAEYERLCRTHGAADPLAHADGGLLAALAERLLAMGAGVVVLKLGERGLYMRTTADAGRIAAMGAAAAWTGRELMAACYRVEAAGTTGAGDCTIAGFLAGWLQGLPPEEALDLAVAVGACNVERPDATSGVPSLAAVRGRIAAGWGKREPALPAAGAGWQPAGPVWRGPNDRAAADR